MPTARQRGRPGPDQQIGSGIDLGVHSGIFTDFWVGLGRGWCAALAVMLLVCLLGPSLGGYCWLGDVLIAWNCGRAGGAVMTGLARGGRGAGGLGGWGAGGLGGWGAGGLGGWGWGKHARQAGTAQRQRLHAEGSP